MAARAMPIRSKLMLGLLGFSTVPLVLLGWFVCLHVNRAQRATVMQVQEAGQNSIQVVRNLSQCAARLKADRLAGEVAGFLQRHPGAGLDDLARLDSLQRAATDGATVGCFLSFDLLVDDKPVSLSELFERTQLGVGSGGADPFRVRPAAAVTADTAPLARKAYAYVANVAGSRLKVAARVENLGVDPLVDEVGRRIESIDEGAGKAIDRTMDNLKVMLVIGVTGIVVVLTVVGGQVARTITRPIQKLTTAAEQISAGRKDVDLDVRGGRELQLLAAAFNKATSELRAYADSLERKNVELDVARRVAVKAGQDLKDAQDELIQMEKMSSLGRLVAGVAHEINTPTGAIYNVTAETTGCLDTMVGGMDRLRGMTPDEFRQFRHFLDVAVARLFVADRLPRKEKLELGAALEQAGVPDAKKYTELLAKCHLTGVSEGVELARLLAKYDVGSMFTALVEIHASAKISRTSAEKITQIVRALKFYSHNGEQSARTSTDINQTVRDALIILHNRLKSTAEVELKLAEGLPRASCAGGITEVWVNLLTNACDSIDDRAGDGPAGGEFQGRIGIESFRSGDAVHVVVRDNGRPIPPGIVSRIFDPFFTTKPPGKGTGLGLAVVMATVKRNGGMVNVKSSEGSKSFEIALPVEKKEPNEGQA